MKKTFEVEDKEYAVITPTAQVRKESQIEHSRVFGELLSMGTILTRDKLEKLIEKNEMWDAESQKEYKKLNKELAKEITTLEAGDMKLNKARTLAIKIAEKRSRLNDLTAEYRKYDSITVDSKAESAAFDYLVAHCTVDNETGEKIYKDLDDYLNNRDTLVGTLAYINMLQLENGSIDEIQKNLPENKFLREWNFVDDDLRFIDKDGQFIDKDGKPVTEDGFYVDDKPEVEAKPFLDDDGNPIEKPE